MTRDQCLILTVLRIVLDYLRVFPQPYAFRFSARKDGVVPRRKIKADYRVNLPCIPAVEMLMQCNSTLEEHFRILLALYSCENRHIEVVHETNLGHFETLGTSRL